MIDWDAVWSNVPQITGLDLHLWGRKWYGQYYIDGTPHASRRDKLVVGRGRDGMPLVLEQGGESMTLWKWLSVYGGVAQGDVRGVLERCERRKLADTCRQWQGECRYVGRERWLEEGGDMGVWTDPLYIWLCGMFPAEKVAQVLERYHVTSGLRDRRTGIVGTRFWYFDSEGRICHDKTMFYGPDGHRMKDLRPLRRYQRKWGYCGECLFGEDSVDREGSIKVVESEKTALLAALQFGGNWVATGGMNALSGLRKWQGRRIWLVPDVDGAGQWERHGRIWRWWENCGMQVGQKWDIGDLIVEMKKGEKFGNMKTSA